MDKLEKALQKAREMRQVVGVQAVGRDGDRQGAAGRGPHVAQALPEGSVAMDEDLLEENRIVAHRTRSAEADLFRLLRAQILQTMAARGFKTLAVTSANYGEGKTTIALNLGLSIAQDQKQTVLLVDMDLRKPSVNAYLGLEKSCGLTDCLAGTAQLSDCLVRLPFARMTVLPAGQQVEQSSETIGSPKMGALAEELKMRYADRLIIYDMPPLLAQDDPLAFLPHVDAVLLVVQDGVTKTSEIKRSLEILASAQVLGIVLNNAV